MGFLNRLIGFVMFWKPKQRRVKGLLFRDDRVIGESEYPVTDRYMVDEKKSRAWGLHSGLLVDFESKPHSVLIEHDCAPQGQDGNQWDPDETEWQQITGEQYDKQMTNIEKESKKGKAYSMMVLLLLLLGLFFMFLMMVALIRSGHLHIPNLSLG